jgi:hypothetical protein
LRQWKPSVAFGKGVRNVARHGFAKAKELAGAERHFCIRGSYRHRTEVLHFDDSKFKDEYQREVYLRAAALATAENVKTVYDVGCGSGYKLVQNLGQYDTIGFELPQTLEFLRETYPDRKWHFVPFSIRRLTL